MIGEYQIYLRDANLKRVAQVDQYYRLELLLRYLDVSTFILDIPSGTDAALLATVLASGANGIIIKRNGATLISGNILDIQRGWIAKQDSVIRLSGVDDSVWLKARGAWPDITGDFTLSAYDVQTGIASTIFRHYVYGNAGAAALARRQVAGLVLPADPLLGASVTLRARFDTLLGLFTPTAEQQQLGVRIVQNDSEQLEFQVYQAVDKTADVKFSAAIGNLSSSQWQITAPTANAVIVAGGGEGTARTIIERQDLTSQADYYRYEGFLDRRDTTDTTELNQAGDEALTQNAVKTNLNIEVADTESVRFQDDYGLGDKVTVVVTEQTTLPATEATEGFPAPGFAAVNPGAYEQIVYLPIATIEDVVREVHIVSGRSEGEIITPVVGTAGAHSNKVLDAYRQMAELRRRILDLERRR